MAGGQGGSGGGVYNRGTLTVVGSRILSSTATSGGGIDSFGTLTILSSTLAYNTATTGAGGALEVLGSATISNSQIYGNRANGGNGGGLYAVSGSSLTIDHTLLDSNVATVLLKGTATIFTLAIYFKSSPARCAEVPLPDMP